MHSCDQCRKGKRACDARVHARRWKHTFASDSNPNGNTRLESSSTGSCSHCKRYKKTCTFNWLTSKAGKKTISALVQDDEQGSPNQRLSGQLDHGGESEFLFHKDNAFSTLPLRQPRVAPGHVTGEYPVSTCALPPRAQDIPGIHPNDREYSDTPHDSQYAWQFDDGESVSPCSLSNSFGDTSDHQSQYGGLGPHLDDFCFFPEDFMESNQHQLSSYDFPQPKKVGNSKLGDRVSLCALGDILSSEYTRSMMTQNLIRIYHDSMENALSCWLTERNCPYNITSAPSQPAENLFLDGLEIEWGPRWSNRICTRVCRLDRVYSLVRGRRLTAAEDRTASRTLHTSIMAFASQWAQNSQARMGDLASSVAQHERSIRETLWSQARQALSDSLGIPSFRVVFANIVLSLAQRPLDVEEDIEVDELLDNDCAPVFLETAVRQLFTFRYKLSRLKRQISGYSTQSKRELEISRDPILTNTEFSETFNLLFWLGVMFDTLTAAMHQRPPVISDEDSQIPCVSLPSSPATNSVDLNGWSIASNHTQRKQDNLWGDLFLHKPAVLHQGPRLVRWPFSYGEAAETLSDATPVKVLLYRRITHLQNLIYRGAKPEALEDAIQSTLLVYQHWNSVYGRFMLDCMANHQDLMPRIQSWYVILAGHWHLATMILADTVETIDQTRISLVSRREYREAIGLVTTLRRENAFKVGGIAQCSLSVLDLPHAQLHDFHDSVSEVAFLTEPWTIVLIRCFTKAACILLNEVDGAPYSTHKWDSPFEQSWRHCRNCINALWMLGRKSDMAFLAARSLYRNLATRGA